jgi:hypothetical protein
VTLSWREREFQAVATLRECREALAARGTTVIHEAANGAGEFAQWQHYPEGEVYDRVSHTQYFYHRHPGPARAALGGAPEHGHFHLFLRGDGMPLGVTPLLLPDIAVANAPPPRQSAPLKRGVRDEVCHLVAVAIDLRGEPMRLFTTNRWVTGETWYRADDVIRMLDLFKPGGDHPSPLLNRWLTALVCLFKPEITVLLRRRDKQIAEWRWRSPADPFEEPRLEITSSEEIDLDARLAAVEERDAAAARRNAGTQSPLPLSGVNDGWGA